MQHYQKELQKLGLVFQNKDPNYATLTSAISKYKEIVYTLTKVDLDSDVNRQSIYGSNGKAIGLTWAALCLEDMVRTKTFISGVFKAVQKLHNQGKKQVHILYAGTGPFATLILPVLASYTPAQVTATLLEINTESFNTMQMLLQELGFEDHVVTYANVDATTYTLSNPESIDILLTETLECGLVKEPQIPITINLLQQLPSEVILIPEQLALDVVWLEPKAFMEREVTTDEKEYCTVVFRLIELDKMSHQDLPYDLSLLETQKLASKEMIIHPEDLETNKKLALLTRITIFEEEKIHINESGLTLPIYLKMPSVINQQVKLTVSYEAGENPGYRLEYDTPSET